MKIRHFQNEGSSSQPGSYLKVKTQAGTSGKHKQNDKPMVLLVRFMNFSHPPPLLSLHRSRVYIDASKWLPSTAAEKQSALPSCNVR